MKSIFVACTIIFALGCASRKHDSTRFEYRKPEALTSKDKITGVNLEMPSKKVDSTQLDSIRTINAEWVALIPFGFSNKGEANVQFRYKWQWWGETEEGSLTIGKYARAAGQKLMVKPHVWVMGAGWPGEFDLETEQEWKVWEESYRTYILTFAKVADSLDAEIYCIGTEYRNAAAKREQFWRDLIHDVRAIYSGKVTYAANWDNYERVKFWDELDYIGIDAYFPVSKNKTPTLEEWKEGWSDIADKLETFSAKYDKQVLFTEYGFKSADFAGMHVDSDREVAVNLENQFNAYQAFFETIWSRDFFAGGFLWKWTFFPTESNSGENHKKFTPQGKPAFKVVKEVYGS